MGLIKIGCQTYTWEMLGDQWTGTVEDIVKEISEAGYSGIEITNTMIGDYYNSPKAFQKLLEKYNIELAAFGFSSFYGFTEPERRMEELEAAQRALDFVSQFPNPKLGLGGASSKSGKSKDKLLYACDFYNEVGRRGKNMGVSVNVHPTSGHGSIIQTKEEYDLLLNNLDSNYVSFGPDTGHILRGDQDLFDTIKKYVSRITHIHFKDVNKNGEWRPIGEGMSNYRGIIEVLMNAKYNGWIICEDESNESIKDRKKVLSENFKRIKKLLESAE